MNYFSVGCSSGNVPRSYVWGQNVFCWGGHTHTNFSGVWSALSGGTDCGCHAADSLPAIVSHKATLSNQ
jgi:hypothetical protein